MLKKIVKHWKIILAGFCILFALSTPILWKYRYHIKNLLVVRLGNSIELDENSKLLATFSFKDISQSQLVDKSVHYKFKLVESSGIPITKDEILDFKDPSIPLIFTLETWGVNGYVSFKQDELEAFYKGKYDKLIQDFCISIIGDRPNVYFRLNREVEVYSLTFPWQGHLISYQKAFDHLSKLTSSYAPQVKQIFGGAGYSGVMEYCPDVSQVDIASVVLSPETEQPLKYYPKYNSVNYDLFRRLHRMRFLDKPIFVFGTSESDRASVNQELLDSIKNKVLLSKETVYSESNFITKKKQKHEYSRDSFEFGLYDPQSLLNNEKSVTTEHIFIDLSQLQNGGFEKAFKNVLERNHDVIVTFEPWKDSKGRKNSEVLEAIINNGFDDEIAELYSILSQTSKKVYLRFAHEMEIPITRYSWQSQDPIVYIKAFRHVMTFKDVLPSNIKRVWGPAGDRGSDEFWPGNDVVDIISFAIYGLPNKNITDPNKQKSFNQIFKLKKRRMRHLDKPIFITEFGVKGPEEYQKNWIDGAAKILRDDPQIIGANYFNMSDSPGAWGDIEAPDWSISKETMDHFINTLNNK